MPKFDVRLEVLAACEVEGVEAASEDEAVAIVRERIVFPDKDDYYVVFVTEQEE